MSWLDDVEGSQAVDGMARARAMAGVGAGGLAQSEAPPAAPAAVPPAGGGAPGAAPAAGGEPDLVDWNGGRISRRIVGQADALYKEFPGLRLSSSHRSPEHNREVGGVKHSDHLTGDAMDFTGSSKDMYGIAARARQMGAKQAMVHNVGSGMHAHVAF